LPVEEAQRRNVITGRRGLNTDRAARNERWSSADSKMVSSARSAISRTIGDLM
jgi:hypothetical protein